MSKQIKATMIVAQDDEVNAGVALADYKFRIESENEDLAEALVNQQNRLADLLIEQIKSQIKVTECLAELSTVGDSLHVSIEEQKNSEEQYVDNRKASIDERDIFDYVVSIYESGVKPNHGGPRRLDTIEALPDF